jgi:hypothetical protein
LTGGAGSGGSFGFITVELKEDDIYPYRAFNGKMILRLNLPYMNAYDRLDPEYLPDLVNYDVKFVPHYTIELLYATALLDGWRIRSEYGFEIDRNKIITVANPLVFNGKEFSGDYELIFSLEKRLRTKWIEELKKDGNEWLIKERE